MKNIFELNESEKDSIRKLHNNQKSNWGTSLIKEDAGMDTPGGNPDYFYGDGSLDKIRKVAEKQDDIAELIFRMFDHKIGEWVINPDIRVTKETQQLMSEWKDNAKNQINSLLFDYSKSDYMDDVEIISNDEMDKLALDADVDDELYVMEQNLSPEVDIEIGDTFESMVNSGGNRPGFVEGMVKLGSGELGTEAGEMIVDITKTHNAPSNLITGQYSLILIDGPDGLTALLINDDGEQFELDSFEKKVN